MRATERAIAGVVGAALIALWVWMSFISGNEAPFGIKLIGTTCTILAVGLILILVWEAILDRRDAKTPILSRVRRQTIPKHVQNQVWIRDQGRCQWREHGEICGRRELLEFDHILPFSKGGPNTYRNLQLLCQEHNRFKAANDHEPPKDLVADIPAEAPEGWSP